MRKDKRRFSLVVSALVLAAALLAIGTPQVPLAAAFRSMDICESTPEGGCCACYPDDTGYQCHSGANIGSSYCDSGTEYCAKTPCFQPS